MKINIAILLAALCTFGITEKTWAQLRIGDYELSSVNAGSGKGSLTSGFDVTALFKNSRNVLEVTGNSDRVYIQHFWGISGGVSAAASGGFFKNTPWLGCQLLFMPDSAIKIMEWSGFSYGVAGTNEWKPQWFFHTISASAQLNENFAACFTAIKFQGCDWDLMPGAAFTLPLKDKFSLSVGVDYSTLYVQPFYRIGVMYKVR
ncbi:MAG: hypothetical protein V1909_02050 [Candidatus Micrarchaeota archaeon]